MNKNNFKWPDKKQVAVSLTYDDGLPVHRTAVADILEKNALLATFYTHIRGKDLLGNPESWRELSAKGHELGNHSLFHPCRRSEKRKGWLEEYYDLMKYTRVQWRNELEIANFTLSLIDGKSMRSYGNTCCDTTIGSGDAEESMDGILEELFIAARGPLNETVFNPRKTFNPMQIGHFSGDSKSFDQIKEEITKASDLGGWIVFMIHGVGKGTHNLYIEEGQHCQLIDWLGENKEHIWTAPFIDVAKYVVRYEPV